MAKKPLQPPADPRWRNPGPPETAPVEPPGSPHSGDVGYERFVRQEELETQNAQLMESQRQLEESRDRFSTLYDFSPVPYVTLCDQGLIREINLTGAALLGRDRQQLIDRPFMVFVDPPYRRSLLNHMAACRAGKAPLTTELMLQTRDGGAIPVELRSRPILLDGPRGRYHLSVLIDTVERHRLDREREQLRAATQTEQLLRTVLHTLPVAVRMVGPDGQALLFNEACRDVWGIPSGAPLPPFDHQEGWEPKNKRKLSPEDWPVARALRGETGARRETILTKGFDNARRVVMQSAVPMHDHTGAIIGAVEVTEDVTRLLEAQEAAGRRQEQLEAAFDASRLSFWNWDMTANNVTWSGPLERIFQNDPAEALGMDQFFARIHAEDITAVRTAMEHARQSRSAFEAEFRLADPAPEARWLSAKGQFNFAGANAIRMTGVMMDITSRKHAEVQLRAAKEAAEEASRLKDDFLATVSHELRTPLSAILLWTHLAKGTLRSRKDMGAALDTIHRSATAQSQIIEDLLDISRGIAGKLRLNLQTISLAPAIRSALEGARPSADAKQIQLQVDIPDDLPPVQIDPDRMQQVAWNLLSNAIKFTGIGGKVSVKLLLHAAEGEPQMLRLVVSDTGQGIAPDFLPHIFDRFRQAESGTTRMHGGLGLGMAIARELVQMHGGVIGAESAGLNKGTTFTVDLPLALTTPGVRSLHKPLEPADALKGLNVLVVEDEPSTRAALGRLLETAGAAVRTVGSADAALGAFRRNPPDVLISDIAMPGHDGYAMLREMRALEPRRRNGHASSPRRMHAIALTARARAEDRAQSMAAGYEAHLSKPIDPNELITTIADLCTDEE